MPMMGTIVRRALAALAFALLSGGGAGSQQRTRIVVYTTLEPDNIAAYKRAFEADNPDIEIVWQRDSTGVVTAKVLAERERPSGDAIWGLAITSMMQIDREGLLTPYAPANLAAIKPRFRDPKTPPAWVGMEAWVAALCFNRVEADKLGLPTPGSWFDLLDPRFKGRVVMPHPASSGTGYFHVSAWIQLFGEEKAWAFMDALHQNIAAYEHSGSRPCRQAAAGEFAVGISYELGGATARQQGAPIEVLLMREGGGWDMDAAAILKGGRHPEVARRLMDWAASRKANELYARYVSQVAIDGVPSAIPHYPAGVAESMIKNDFVWASENRTRILDEWRRRYESKAAPRK